MATFIADICGMLRDLAPVLCRFVTVAGEFADGTSVSQLVAGTQRDDVAGVGAAASFVDGILPKRGCGAHG